MTNTTALNPYALPINLRPWGYTKPVYYLPLSPQGAIFTFNASRHQLNKLNLFTTSTPQPQPSLNHHHQELEVYIYLTNACLFNCPGCAAGVDQRKRTHTYLPDITLPQLLQALQQVFFTAHQNHFTHIKFKYAGGEPTLPPAFAKLCQAHQYIQHLHQQYPHLTTEEVILSAGGKFFTPTTLTKISKLNIKISLSLWGIDTLNDQSRRPTPGSEFRNFFPTIAHALRLNLLANIHHVITPTNAKHFPDFITALWDTTSPHFLGRQWPSSLHKPLPLSINFLRPQTPQQHHLFIKYGYHQMVQGFLNGLNKIQTMILNNIPIPLATLLHLDYLNLQSPTPRVCGAGQNYLVITSSGFTYCHEAYNHTLPFHQAQKSTNLLQTINQLSQLTNDKYLQGHHLDFSDIPNPRLGNILSLVAGSGCPRSRRAQNHNRLTSKPGAIATHLYAPILTPLLQTIALALAHSKQVS